VNNLKDTFFLVLVVIAANSCSPNQEKLTELETNYESCNSDTGIEYICGPANAEDLLSIGDTGMLIASGSVHPSGIRVNVYCSRPSESVGTPGCWASKASIACSSSRNMSHGNNCISPSYSCENE